MQVPPLYVGHTPFRLIPAEWAHGVVEVKSKLTGPELKKAQRSIAHAKQLQKLTYSTRHSDLNY
jgi:hypothetical protein